MELNQVPDSNSALDENDPAIISVLHHLQHESLPSSSLTTSTVDPEAGLEGWTAEQLRQEVIRLREEARHSSILPQLEAGLHVDLSHQFQDPAINEKKPKAKGKGKRPRLLNDDGSAVVVKKVKPTSARDGTTGKRLEGKRKVELAKAIREKMRSTLGIGPNDPLPAPSQPGSTNNFVPDWEKGILNETNVQWIDSIVSSLLQEATSFDKWSTVQRDPLLEDAEDSSYNRWLSIPREDLAEDVIQAAARTAFLNFAKTYSAAVDVKAAERKGKYTKHRRRWARKDLKQKRRAKAAADPLFNTPLPPSALHIDYMSSEYSSEGEEEQPRRAKATAPVETPDSVKSYWKNRWDEALSRREAQFENENGNDNEQEKKGKGGWAEGNFEKVLEVRTPSWRSNQLNEIYQNLDAIAAYQVSLRSASSSSAATKNSNQIQANPTTMEGYIPNYEVGSTSTNTNPTNQRPGHVAPSHRRFTMVNGMMRSGRMPKDGGEDWMWASGSVGVWPDVVGQGCGLDSRYEDGNGNENADGPGDGIGNGNGSGAANGNENGTGGGDENGDRNQVDNERGAGKRDEQHAIDPTLESAAA